jgi:hypothetical protein
MSTHNPDSSEFWEISSIQGHAEYGVHKFTKKLDAVKAWKQTGPGYRLAHVKGGVHTVISQSFSTDQEPLLCCGKVAKIPQHDGTFDVSCPDHKVDYTVTRETTGRSDVGVGVSGRLTFRRWF